MKKLILPVIFFAIGLSLSAQSNTETLQELEQAKASRNDGNTSATMKSAGRLFGTKDDLTTVILIIPSGSTVDVLDADSTYYHVIFEDNEGYIFRRQAVINEAPVYSQQNTAQNTQQSIRQSQQLQEEQAGQQQISRFSYLENKYGSNMAARLMAGKIWKGMNAEMVRDSWGTAQKINRVISGNIIKEEWIFRNTWLYFENNTLVEWGPIRQ